MAPQLATDGSAMNTSVDTEKTPLVRQQSLTPPEYSPAFPTVPSKVGRRPITRPPSLLLQPFGSTTPEIIALGSDDSTPPPLSTHGSQTATSGLDSRPSGPYAPPPPSKHMPQAEVSAVTLEADEQQTAGQNLHWIKLLATGQRETGELVLELSQKVMALVKLGVSDRSFTTQTLHWFKLLASVQHETNDLLMELNKRVFALEESVPWVASGNAGKISTQLTPPPHASLRQPAVDALSRRLTEVKNAPDSVLEEREDWGRRIRLLEFHIHDIRRIQAMTRLSHRVLWDMAAFSVLLFIVTILYRII